MLLERCSMTLNRQGQAIELTSARRIKIKADVEELAAAGHRVLAVVVRRNLKITEIEHSDVRSLTW